jgi:hypothetical protein
MYWTWYFLRPGKLLPCLQVPLLCGDPKLLKLDAEVLEMALSPRVLTGDWTRLLGDDGSSVVFAL